MIGGIRKDGCGGAVLLVMGVHWTLSKEESIKVHSGIHLYVSLVRTTSVMF